jgi:hypothetical protein
LNNRKNTRTHPLLPLSNPTSKSMNQAMDVTPPRSTSWELSILLRDSCYRAVSGEIEDGRPPWPLVRARLLLRPCPRGLPDVLLRHLLITGEKDEGALYEATRLLVQGAAAAPNCAHREARRIQPW